ncbi:hypothetical protein [Paludibacterium denitrificans]|uniref:Ferric oxidoreductase domain-containing protein n=1 Tax=Paludibacterium denitrificans TaxID=2675226 RepID=A0A844GCM3_9NEIS|nr:hypothetical protein [Paludibacterium denitrificans]MTD33041.1 hypothetical protein [Paludibacterium denitrificans]
MMALVVIALLKRVPYRAFRPVHKAFGVICLMGAYHSAIFIPAEWWRAATCWAVCPSRLWCWLGSGR